LIALSNTVQHYFRGLFLSINDKGHLYEMMCNWPEQDVKVGCVHYGPLISCYSETSLNWTPSGLHKMCRGFLFKGFFFI